MSQDDIELKPLNSAAAKWTFIHIPQKLQHFFPRNKQFTVVYGEKEFNVTLNSKRRIVSKKLFVHSGLKKGSRVCFKKIPDGRYLMLKL